jgi:hypothetical protein
MPRGLEFFFYHPLAALRAWTNENMPAYGWFLFGCSVVFVLFLFAAAVLVAIYNGKDADKS